MPRADQEGLLPAAPAQPGKVSLLSFVWHEHSLLGLLAPETDVPPPIKPCCCCCVYTDSLTRRHRLFIFAFVLALSTALAVQVSLGEHSGAYATFVMIACVTPLTCHLKSNLRGYSAYLQDHGLGPFAGARCEELLVSSQAILPWLGCSGSIVSHCLWSQLLGGCGYAVVTLGQTVGQAAGLAVVGHALTVWGGAMVSELFCLPAKYIFGRCCCCCCDCCVPRSYLLDPEEQDAETGGGGGGSEAPSVVYMHSDAKVR